MKSRWQRKMKLTRRFRKKTTYRSRKKKRRKEGKVRAPLNGTVCMLVHVCGRE